MKNNGNLFDARSVLVLTDNVNLSPTLNSILSEAGLKPFFVSQASKGLSVLEHAKQSNAAFDLVIADFNLPEVSGLEFVKSVRKSQFAADQKIIVLTPGHPSGYLTEFKRWNVPHVLQWPGRPQDLIGAVAEYIPLAQTELSEFQTTEENAKDQPLRILCADDNAINLAVLKGFLSLAGFSPDSVENGAEAVKAYKNAPYDLILMDIMMPVMDGVIATLQIRELEKQSGRQPVPIVAVTAHYTPSQRNRYIDAGMNDVIAKPIGKAVIDECLEKWCKRYQSGQYSEAELRNTGS